MSATGRWSCGTSSPYWIGMSWALRRVLGRELPAPAQNSTQARPQSAWALRGSSRSRHSSSSRSSRARASSLFDDGASVFTRASVASCTSCPPPTARREVALHVHGRSRRLCVADDPAEDRRAPLGRELGGRRRRARRRARAARRRALLEPVREARGPREPAVDHRRSAGRERLLAQRLLEQRGRTVEALELGEEDERLGAQRADQPRQADRSRRRARVHSPAA